MWPQSKNFQNPNMLGKIITGEKQYNNKVVCSNGHSYVLFSAVECLVSNKLDVAVATTL